MKRWLHFIFLLLAASAFAYAPSPKVVLPSGTYGGMQGVGGLEAVQRGLAYPVVLINDALGNVHEDYNTANGDLTWSGVRHTAYRSVPGREPVALGYGGSFSDTFAWCGKWKDVTGYYWIGKRFYDPEAGRWLSYDSVWNSGDANGYTFCAGDPLNTGDWDGRFGKQAAGVTFDVFTTILAGLFTPQPAPFSYVSPAEQQAYGNISGMVHDAVGHPFQDAGFYEPNSGAADFRDVTAAGLEMYGLAKTGKQMVSMPSFTPIGAPQTQRGAPIEPYTYGPNSYQTWTPQDVPQLLPTEGNAGTYQQLIRAGSKGDNITPHHTPAGDYIEQLGIPYSQGFAMNMEQPATGGRHRQTWSYGRQADLTLSPRDALAFDIRDARQIYIDQGL